MPVKQGDLDLLRHPASLTLLKSTIPARLAHVWTDGTPRVVPIWFHWNQREFVLASPPKAPKLKALSRNPKVALTIDDNNFPHKVLLVRGTARLQTVAGIVPEYARAAERYFGSQQGRAWVEQLGSSVNRRCGTSKCVGWPAPQWSATNNPADHSVRMSAIRKVSGVAQRKDDLRLGQAR